MNNLILSLSRQESNLLSCIFSFDNNLQYIHLWYKIDIMVSYTTTEGFVPSQKTKIFFNPLPSNNSLAGVALRWIMKSRLELM